MAHPDNLEGNLVHAIIHTADNQDCEGATLALIENVGRFACFRNVFAEGSYAGTKLKDALRRSDKCTIVIVRRFDTAKGFEMLPWRWVVNRTRAEPSRNLRHTEDFKQNTAPATAWLFIDQTLHPPYHKI